MSNIPSTILNHLYHSLLACGPFASDYELRAVFSDARISAWRNKIPEANNPDARVKATIDYLRKQCSTNRESALVLFLRVLSEQIDPSTDCHRDLTELAIELEQTLHNSQPDEQIASPLQLKNPRLRLTLSWWIYVLGGFGVILVAILAVWKLYTPQTTPTPTGTPTATLDSYYPADTTASEPSTLPTSNATILPPGKELILRGHSGEIFGVAFSPNNAILATGSGDKTAKLWDVSSGEELHTLSAHIEAVWSVAFSPDGKTLATGSNDATIRIWDVETGQQDGILFGPPSPAFGIAFSPSGRALVSGHADGTVIWWDIRSKRGTTLPAQNSDRIFSVAFSPNGGTLAAGSGNGLIRLWDTTSQEEIRSFIAHSSPVFDLVFSPDSNILASGGLDQQIVFWNPIDGQEIRSLDHKGATVWALAFSPDGNMLASVGNNCCVVSLWDVDSGQNLRTLRGPDNSVYGIAFSTDGNMVAAGTEEGAVWLWDIR